MKARLNERADPYDAESCRCWFRDLILGVEYRKFCLRPIASILEEHLLVILLTRC
jgi:hypothetical protein